MKLTANLTGLLDLSPRTISSLRDRSRAIVLARIGDLSKEAVKKIKSDIKLVQSKGWPYKSRRPQGGTHIASKPFFPPNEDTGNLRKNIFTRTLPHTVVISSEAVSKKNFPYSVALETGTKFMDPRPYFFKNILEWVEDMDAAQTRLDAIKIAVKNDLASQRRIKRELLK